MVQRGRPRVKVDVDVAEQFLNSGWTLTWIGTCFQVYTAEQALFNKADCVSELLAYEPWL